MLVCLYGSSAEIFLTSTLQTLEGKARERGLDWRSLSFGAAARLTPDDIGNVSHCYVLPFDLGRDIRGYDPEVMAPPPGHLFPKTTVWNPPAAHALCAHRDQTIQLLLQRGIPVPESCLTDSASEALEFIRSNELTVLKATQPGAGRGDLVVAADDTGGVIGETASRRYVVELDEEADARHLQHGILAYPPPYFLQRLVARVGRKSVLTAAQVLRAYVIDSQVAFWVERYREHITRPSDFILSPAQGARQRFLQVVSTEADKMTRRTAEVLGFHIGAVDLIRTESDGFAVVGATTDGQYTSIDRSFKNLPEYRDAFDLDRLIIDAIASRM